MKPSASAILVPTGDIELAVGLVEHAFRSRGFHLWSKPIPTGYPLRRDEYFDFGIGGKSLDKVCMILPSDVESVFRVAVVLSSALGSDTPLVAFRRFMGMEPVMKFFVGGRPRWRDGADEDLEVKFTVPTVRPEGFDTPEEHGLPGSAVEMEAVLGHELRRYEALRRDPNAGLEWRAFLSKKSKLHHE